MSWTDLFERVEIERVKPSEIRETLRERRDRD